MSILHEIQPRLIGQSTSQRFTKREPDHSWQADLKVSSSGLLFINQLAQLCEKIDSVIQKKVSEFSPAPIWGSRLFKTSETQKIWEKGVPSYVHKLDGKETCLSPACCYHAFLAIEGMNVSKTQAFTLKNTVYRKENAKVGNPNRSEVFTQREIILITSNVDEVEKLKERLIKLNQEIFEEIFEIDYIAMTASDSFMGELDDLGKTAQLLEESKIEFQSPTIFEKDPIACSSINVHQQRLTHPFRITSSQGPTYSLCSSWGIERLALAILSQYGYKFPESLK